jgi:hypothetical protein
MHHMGYDEGCITYWKIFVDTATALNYSRAIIRDFPTTFVCCNGFKVIPSLQYTVELEQP